MFSSWKSIFSLCDLDMQWIKAIWTIFTEGHIGISPTKFGQNPASSLEGDFIWSNCWQWTTHNGQQTSNDRNSSPWANGSGEQKSGGSWLFLCYLTLTFLLNQLATDYSTVINIKSFYTCHTVRVMWRLEWSDVVCHTILLYPVDWTKADIPYFLH